MSRRAWIYLALAVGLYYLWTSGLIARMFAGAALSLKSATPASAYPGGAAPMVKLPYGGNCPQGLIC